MWFIDVFIPLHMHIPLNNLKNIRFYILLKIRLFHYILPKILILLKIVIGSKHRHRTSEAQLLDHDLLELDEGEEDLLEGHGSSSGAAGSQPVHLTQLKKLPGKKIRKPSVFSTR